MIDVYIDTMSISIPSPPAAGLRAPAALGSFVREGAGAAATPGRVLPGVVVPGGEVHAMGFPWAFCPWDIGKNTWKTPGVFSRFSWLR